MIMYDYLCGQTWAIREQNLKGILEIAARTNITAESIEKAIEKRTARESASSTLKDKTKSSNVAVIDIVGPIVKHGDLFSEISGARSLSGIKKDFLAALGDKDVESIVLNVDSPGGEAGGISEFSDLVYESRGIKPIVTYVGDLACSAAYWIASASDKIICSETATLGSIGCVAVMRDTKEKEAKEGITTVEIVSSNSPNKRPDISTDEGKELIREQINTIGDIFIEKVARNRSIGDKKYTFKDVVNKFNKGGVLIGKDAVEAGLADEIGSYDSILSNLNGTNIVAQNEEITFMTKEKEIKSTEAGTVEETAPELQKLATAGTIVPTVSVEEFEKYKAQSEVLAGAVDSLKQQLELAAKENDKLLQDALRTKAESFVASVSDRIVPANQETVVKAYVQAANDDKNNPIDGFSRVDNLVAVYTELPKHNLTEELMVLDNNTEASSFDADKESLRKIALEFASKENAKK